MLAAARANMLKIREKSRKLETLSQFQILRFLIHLWNIWDYLESDTTARNGTSVRHSSEETLCKTLWGGKKKENISCFKENMV